MRTFNYTIDGLQTSAINFFETLRILVQFKSKKVQYYTEKELTEGVTIDGYLFKIN